MDKHVARKKRGRRTRMHLKELGVEKGIARFCVHRSNQHIAVQIISPKGEILAAAYSVEKALRGVKAEEGQGQKMTSAKRVGQLVAERAQEKGITKVACDRSGFRYHGRVAACVQAARETGLII